MRKITPLALTIRTKLPIIVMLTMLATGGAITGAMMLKHSDLEYRLKMCGHPPLAPGRVVYFPNELIAQMWTESYQQINQYILRSSDWTNCMEK
jgi:hypothetical protein